MVDVRFKTGPLEVEDSGNGEAVLEMVEQQMTGGLEAEENTTTDYLTKKVVVVIPAFNEERFIGSVVLKACRYAHTVIVIDDGSSDGTCEVAAVAGAVVIRHERNQGKGMALNTAFRAARDYEPDVVVTLDADGQHLPEELVQIVEPVLQGQADIVIGSRYLAQGCQTPYHRRWGHRAFNLITRLASGVQASDSQSGFRAFSAKALSTIGFYSNGFSVESEMQFIARENGLRLFEVPATIQYTDYPKRSVISHGLLVMNGMLRIVEEYRPLLFFGMPGVLFLFGGMVWGMTVIDIYTRIKYLAAGYAMLSVLFTIVGLLSLSTGIILHSMRTLLIDFQKRKMNL